jgi:hypothetical protein
VRPRLLRLGRARLQHLPLPLEAAQPVVVKPVKHRPPARRARRARRTRRAPLRARLASRLGDRGPEAALAAALRLRLAPRLREPRRALKPERVLDCRRARGRRVGSTAAAAAAAAAAARARGRSLPTLHTQRPGGREGRVRRRGRGAGAVAEPSGQTGAGHTNS